MTFSSILFQILFLIRFQDDSVNNILVRPNISRSSVSIRMRSPRPMSARSFGATDASEINKRGNLGIQLEGGRSTNRQEKDIRDLAEATIKDYRGSKHPSQWKWHTASLHYCEVENLDGQTKTQA